METKESPITFVDTNILIPSSSWDLYNSYLDQYKQNNPQHLTPNPNIDETALSYALSDICLSHKIINEKNVIITKGVQMQTNLQVIKTLDNIDKRVQSYFFADLNVLLSKENKEKNKRIFSNLTKYRDEINKTNEIIDKNPYVHPKEEPYFVLVNLARALKDNFFEIGKKDHPYDGNTDEFITVSCIYESLKNNKNAEIISNDGDIADLLSVCYVLIKSMEPLCGKKEQLKHFCEVPPKIYSAHDLSKGLAQIDIKSKGENIVSRLTGDYSSGILKDAEKAEYFSKLTRLSRFLEITSKELLESL